MLFDFCFITYIDDLCRGSHFVVAILVTLGREELYFKMDS